MNMNFFTVAAYQGPAIQGNPKKAFETIFIWIEKAQKQKADIILFPETFLHGYFNNAEQAHRFSIDLNSYEFRQWCQKLHSYTPMIIFGVNERDQDKIYNTTVVLQDGKLIGKMRKTTTYPPYDYYALGQEFSIFEKRGIRFGIVICADINYIEPARILALNGAQIIFCPMWNIIKRTHSLLPHIQAKHHFIARASENYVWFVASDVIHEDTESICLGASCIVDPLGNIVAQGQVLTENLIIYNIPFQSLDRKMRSFDYEYQERLLKAKGDQFQQMATAYEKKF